MSAVHEGLAWLRGTDLFSVYQPIVGLTGEAVAYEALLRGVSHGVELDAGTLFRQAERDRVERLLDRAAAESAVLGAAGWLGSRLLFVNMAPVSFLGAATWLDALLAHLAGTGIDPQQVVVELNEEQRAADLPGLARLLQEARSSGLKVALDDVVGDDTTDQWSQALEPDFLKVDGSVVRGLADVGGLLPLERVIRAADRIDATVIAEQVELVAQLDMLHFCGVELVQGWLTGVPERLGPPLSLAALA